MQRLNLTRFLTTTVVLTACSFRCSAQAPLDTARQLIRIANEAARVGAKHGESIWPGYRPDTIPLVFVLPSRGAAIVGWKGALPAGYAAVPGLAGIAWRDQRALGAASTAASLDGRPVAQVVVQGLEPARLVGVALHEAFHVFQAASRRAGARFGQGENSMLVSTYPVFDVENEAAFALEGRILAAANSASSTMRKRELAQQFVAVRRARHQRLSSEFTEFDVMSELNEGLAEYALVRALQIEGREGPADWRAEARKALAARVGLLEALTGSDNLSLRFRFYQTGPVEALLLDALAGPRWKPEMMTRNSTLQDMLARASGVDSVAISALVKAEATMHVSTLRTKARSDIERLKARRQATADSLLAVPGLRLVLVTDSLARKGFNACGYDPQNLLQVSPSVSIQMRWWKPCAAGPTNTELNVPSVYDAEAGRIDAVIGDAGDVRLSSRGEPVLVRDGETVRNVLAFRLDAPRASVQAARADVTRSGIMLLVHPKAP